jgi:hypothetical protein
MSNLPKYYFQDIPAEVMAEIMSGMGVSSARTRLGGDRPVAQLPQLAGNHPGLVRARGGIRLNSPLTNKRAGVFPALFLFARSVHGQSLTTRADRPSTSGKIRDPDLRKNSGPHRAEFVSHNNQESNPPG